MKKFVVIFGSLILFPTLAFVIIWHVVWSEPKQAARLMADEFKKMLNVAPQVTINSKVYLREASPIAEFATAEMPVTVDSTFTSTWLGSTKTISVEGVYVVKAGFDLNQGFSVDLQPQRKRVLVRMPNPRLLSCELKQSDITDQHGGVINWLSPQDHQAALEQNKREAEVNAGGNGLLRKAK